ncbi:MarR family transcriptional regulator [Novosphingobium sp. FSY-8]|uniref:MarR family transcriptional regulator n=1 Tax=Novosphingobium ovatum TaxID=1908523 RepID=A0ABW9XDG7_9SPHN|nr:MarR family winged helix-turn-helix transcriptional regulator [Novosphingobium ovatum]NBC36565.1 MarR family transcriptional regulator [Novosphingobium ovatum]
MNANLPSTDPAPVVAGLPDDACLTDQEERLYALLIRLLKMASLMATPMKVGVCDPAGVTPNEAKTLMALAGEGPMAGHDLVTINGMAPMNVSRAIASLRDRGWLVDAVDPENRRRRPVCLTEAGEEAYRAMMPSLTGLASDVLSALTQRQQREMIGLTDIVLERLAAWTGPEGGEEG